MRELIESLTSKYRKSVRYWHELSDDEKVSGWLAQLQSDCESEGREATDPKTALEMSAWDVGYEGRRVPATWKKLGKAIGVDVAKHVREGKKARKEFG